MNLAPSRRPVSRRSALRQPHPPPRRPCESLASDSLPHLSDSDYKLKISPSSTRSTKIRYAQLAVVLYSYLPVLQHEHDGFSDCKKNYIKHLYTSVNSFVPVNECLHIEDYIPFVNDSVSYRPVRISLRPLKRSLNHSCSHGEAPPSQHFPVTSGRDFGSCS